MSIITLFLFFFNINCMLLSAALKQRVGLDDAFKDAHIIYVDENNC